MLKITHKHHLDFPHITLPAHHAMELSPAVIQDNDELAQAIINDQVDHDNNWVLTDTPDQSEIDRSEQLWNTIVEDVRHDPEWFRFSAEDE